MNKSQENLLVAIRDALEARPERPNYSDYENGLMSREEYYNQEFQYTLVDDIVNLLIGE